MFISNDEMLDMVFYYKKINKWKYVIYNEKEFEKKELSDEEISKYNKLILECTVLDFGLSNSLHMDSMVEGSDGFKEFNAKFYNENKLLRVIKGWNAKDKDGKPIPITLENIRNLAPEIGNKIIKDYDNLHWNEEQEKN